MLAYPVAAAGMMTFRAHKENADAAAAFTQALSAKTAVIPVECQHWHTDKTALIAVAQRDKRQTANATPAMNCEFAVF